MDPLICCCAVLSLFTLPHLHLHQRLRSSQFFSALRTCCQHQPAFPSSQFEFCKQEMLLMTVFLCNPGHRRKELLQFVVQLAFIYGHTTLYSLLIYKNYEAAINIYSSTMLRYFSATSTVLHFSGTYSVFYSTYLIS